jgi:hypothetical protein
VALRIILDATALVASLLAATLARFQVGNGELPAAIFWLSVGLVGLVFGIETYDLLRVSH